MIGPTIPLSIEIPSYSIPLADISDWEWVTDSDLDSSEELEESSLGDACYHNNLSLVWARLQEKVDVKPQEYFIIDDESPTNLLHLAAVQGYDELADLLLGHLFEKDQEYAKALFSPQNDTDFPLLYLALLNREKSKTALVFLEWAARFEIEPKNLSQEISFKELAGVANADGISDLALRMLFRTLACVPLPKENMLVSHRDFLGRLLEENWSQEEYDRLAKLHAFFATKQVSTLWTKI